MGDRSAFWGEYCQVRLFIWPGGKKWEIETERKLRSPCKKWREMGKSNHLEKMGLSREKWKKKTKERGERTDKAPPERRKGKR